MIDLWSPEPPEPLALQFALSLMRDKGCKGVSKGKVYYGRVRHAPDCAGSQGDGNAQLHCSELEVKLVISY